MKNFFSKLSIGLLLIVGIGSAFVFADRVPVVANLTIAQGGTATSTFTTPSGGVSSILFFNGLSLTSDATPANLGYSTSTNTLNVKNFTVTGTSTVATTTINGTLTLNGALKNRLVGYASNASTTINTDTTDVATTTLTATTTFVNFAGTAYDGQMVEIIATATTSQGTFWGTVFASSTDLNNISSVASGTTRWVFEYSVPRLKWELVGLLKTY